MQKHENDVTVEVKVKRVEHFDPHAPRYEFFFHPSRVICHSSQGSYKITYTLSDCTIPNIRIGAIAPNKDVGLQFSRIEANTGDGTDLEKLLFDKLDQNDSYRSLSVFNRCSNLKTRGIGLRVCITDFYSADQICYGESHDPEVVNNVP